MKPHTHIIYYTLLCVALNYRRSRAHIDGGMEREQALLCVFVCTYLHQYVCVQANMGMRMFSYGVSISICIIIIHWVDVVALQFLIYCLNANY